MKSLPQLLSALGLNAVPAAGWFVGSWSAGTTLGVYWFENVAASLFIAARIALHRKSHPCRGHAHYQPRDKERRGRKCSFLEYFLTISLIFSGAHGFFLGMIILVLTLNGHGAEVGLNLRELGTGCGLVFAMLAADFTFDLRKLQAQPFAWIERMADANLGRVVVVHLSLIFGLAAVAFTGANRAFFTVFIVLKTMADLSTRVPQWNPDKPPAWLCRIMDRVPNAQAGKAKGKPQTFEEFWIADKADEVARLAANERPAQN
jgi:hypothetical protein